jgi:hypothetical protein
MVYCTYRMEGCAVGQILHGSATTIELIRRAIQCKRIKTCQRHVFSGNRQGSLIALSRRYGVNPKTVAKWRRRTTVSNARTGPTDPKSTVLTIDEEAVIVAFRKHALLPLDDCLYSLQPIIALRDHAVFIAGYIGLAIAGDCKRLA